MDNLTPISFTVPQDKWIEVYNSVILLLFFSYEYKNNPASIEAINKRLNSFCSENNITGKDFHFEGGANTLSFCYLIIVRIIEIINNAANGDDKARKQFFQCTIETAKQDGFTSFENITANYCIATIRGQGRINLCGSTEGAGSRKARGRRRVRSIFVAFCRTG